MSYKLNKSFKNMQQKIHPNYTKTKITCACGAILETNSTVENIEVEICSQCHPFYTGKKKVVDTAGRVERFEQLAKKAAAKKADIEKATKAKKEKAKKKKVAKKKSTK